MNYMGPLSGLRWESLIPLIPGEEAVLDTVPSADATLSVAGPPGADVVIGWGTSSAKYVVPPDGVLEPGAAPSAYSIRSCPADMLHSCWSVAVNASGTVRLVIHYGLKADSLAAILVGASATSLPAYLLVRRYLTRTGREVRGSPP